MTRVQLDTERLLLRELREDDWQAMHEYHSDPVVRRYMRPRFYHARQTHEFVLRTMAQAASAHRGYFGLAIVRKTEPRLIGFCSLYVRNAAAGRASVGWEIARPYWRQGYATEAARALLGWGFGTLGLHSVFAESYRANVGSIRVMEKLGMEPEQGAWQLWLPNLLLQGEVRPMVHYGLLRPEAPANPRV